MKKYSYFLIFAGVFLFSISFNSCQPPTKKTVKNIQKPNIIYILADDLGYGDLGCYGQQKIQTPRIDQMAAEGITFTNHYAGSTVCAPSRCSLMTGMDTGHSRIRGNSNVPLQPEDITIAEVLKETGYQTAIIGKWGLGEAGSTGTPNKQGFDYFFGYLNQIRAHNSYPDYLWRNDVKVPLPNEIIIADKSYAKGIGSASTNKAVHSNDLFTEEALKYIDKENDNPFFLYLAYTIPHANNEFWLTDKHGMEVPSLGQYIEKDWPEVEKAKAAMITRLDGDVGKILDLLKKKGIDENTIVIFTSDNGPHAEGNVDPEFFDSNKLLTGIKRDLYDGGIRVPMIARYPGQITAGSQTGLVSAFWDVLPTCAELANAKTDHSIDGISFLPTLLGNSEKQQQHEYLYWEFHEQGRKQAIRQRNWKLVFLIKENKYELFNLDVDISESNDLAAIHPEKLEELKNLLKDSRTENPDFSFKN